MLNPKDMFISDENEVFAKWRQSGETEKDEWLGLLVKLLTKHAYGVCWKKIPDLQGEFSWIVNESVWRAVERSKNFRGGSKFSTWFHRIVLNECSRLLKKRQQRAEDELSVEELENDDRVSVDVGGVDNSVDSASLKARLSPGDRRLFEMYMLGMTGEEIGEELGISPGDVRIKWWRLKKGLKDAL